MTSSPTPHHPTRRVLLLAALAGSAATPQAGHAAVVSNAAGKPGDSEPRARWARVLQDFVDDQGRVDFDGVAARPDDLDAYVGWVNHNSPANQPAQFAGPAQVLAYHLNAYNALAMHAIIDDGIPQTLAGLRKVRFFFLKRVLVGGQSISLATYENDVIRALKEPRIHVALNCMSVGCPRLPREPFDAAALDAQLEREARRFFAETRNVRVDDAARTLALSEILSFYTADFLAVAPSLAAYVNRYRATPVPTDYKVEFMPYDWTVNRQPRRGA
jgi:hypothetical protein